MLGSRCICILLAGGLGTRFSANSPKQLVELDGRPILSHSFDVVASSNTIDEIIVVANPAWHEKIRSAVAGSAPIGKKISFVMGGSNRNESVLSALQTLNNSSQNDKILVHDSVRPLLSQDLIERVVNALDLADAVIPVIESDDPLVSIEGNKVVAVQSRKEVHRGQSPQGFRFGPLLEAFSRSSREDLRAATTLYELLFITRTTHDIIKVAGETSNIKVTQPIDHAIALSILREIKYV